MRRIILVILLLLMAATSTSAAEASTKIDDITPEPASFIDSPLDISLDYHRLSQQDNTLHNITMHNWDHIPGTIKLEIVGIHGMVLGQVKRRVKHQARDNLEAEYNLGDMSNAKLALRASAIEQEYNPYGDWWTRSWFQSFQPDKGGAPKGVITRQIGWSINIQDDFPVLGWFKHNFEKLGDIWISADREFDEEGGGPRPRYKRTNNAAQSLDRLKVQRTDIGLNQPYRWFENSYYHFRFKPTIRFKPSQNTAFIDEVAVRVQAELFTSNRLLHFATVNFFVGHNFHEGNTFISVFVEFVNF